MYSFKDWKMKMRERRKGGREQEREGGKNNNLSKISGKSKLV